MNILISFITVLFLQNIQAAEIKQGVPENPCIKNSKSSACEQYLNQLQASAPCVADIQKFCMPKELKKSDADQIKNMTVDYIDACLNENISKLSIKCQSQIKERLKDKCLEEASSNCLKLKGHERLDCLAKSQAKETDECIKH